MVRQKAMLLPRYKSINIHMILDTISNYRLENFTNNTSQAYGTVVSSKMARASLWIGTTLAIFQHTGKWPDWSDLLNIMDNGMDISAAVSFRTAGGQPSGPGELQLCRVLNLLNTIEGEVSTSLNKGMERLIENDGRLVQSSSMNMLEKNWLKAEALAVSECSGLPSLL